ncbi:MAG: electron transfer flavoprotein subunit beta/FixA family protein [Syntrophobacteraceae bacterium]
MSRIETLEETVDILVCVKRVPDPAENEIRLDADGTDIERDNLVYSVNEWDNYAVEEAIRIRDRTGGSVTVVTIDNEEGDEVLRRELAMGADRAIHVWDKLFEGADGEGLARILKAEIEKGRYDLVFTGVQADAGSAQVGGMLAAMLDWPFASIVSHLEVLDEQKIRIHREVAGGNQEVYEMDLPGVLSIQTGINEPRYVPIRGILKASSLDIPIHKASNLGLTADTAGASRARVKRQDYFLPVMGEGADILKGTAEEIIERLIGLLKSKGGIR